MNPTSYAESRTARLQHELDLDNIGPFHVRWYQPVGDAPFREAGPFHSRAELAEHLQRHGLRRPDELLTFLKLLPESEVVP